MRNLPLVTAVAIVLACISVPSTSADEREPYQYSSLKDASDAEILHFMADGKSEIDLEFEAQIKTQLPDGFWNIDARTAALAFAEANRTREHQAAYTLSFGSVDQAAPPVRCTITLADFSSRDYNAVDQHYFLRVDPTESYLAFARSWSAGSAFYNVVHDAPTFDFRLCTLSYEDARKVSDVIWWLNRIEAKSAKTNSNSDVAYSRSGTFSSADGLGKIIFRAESRVVIEVGETSWADYLAERWSDGYGPEVFFNFAEHLIQTTIPERLGAEWTKSELNHPPDFNFDRIYKPVYETEEREPFAAWHSAF